MEHAYFFQHAETNTGSVLPCAHDPEVRCVGVLVILAGLGSDLNLLREDELNTPHIQPV